MKKIGHSSWLIITFFYILLITIDHSNAASNHDEQNEELRFIHREIGLLRDENRHQNMEIAILKEKIGITKDSDDHGMLTSSPDENHRNKRPVRLLPPHLLFGERKNETEQQKQMNRRRFEQPTNCSDLSLIIGYTLNGFYLVKSNDSDNSISANSDIKLETVFCAFKQPEGAFNSSLVEKRIISRRETKPSSGKVLYFHATRNTDFEANGFEGLTIPFDKVLVNLGNAFNGTSGTFTVPKTGVYLFIFRGNVTFPQEKVGRYFGITFIRNGVGLGIGRDVIRVNDVMVNVELDKLTKGNRGDKITVGAHFFESGAKFPAKSISFAAYLMQ